MLKIPISNRMIDESDHFFHNQRTGVASLRRLTGIIPE
jgi:hypothetical protein